MKNVNNILDVNSTAPNTGVMSLSQDTETDTQIPTLGIPYSKGAGLGEEGGFDFTALLNLFGGGGIAGIFSGIFGNIFQEGWSISCIGAQAYNKGDFDREMQEAKTIVDSTNPTNVPSLDNLLNQMSWRYALDLKIANSYRSTCSKTLRLKRADYCKSIIDGVLPNVEYSSNSENATGENNYTWTRYSVTGIKQSPVLPPAGGGSGQNQNNGGISGGGSGPILPGGFNPNEYFDVEQGLMNAFNELPVNDQTLLQNYASTNGKSLSDILNGYFSGQIRIVNGKVVWGVNAGNAQNNEGTNLLIYAGIGFIAYRFLKKK